MGLEHKLVKKSRNKMSAYLGFVWSLVLVGILVLCLLPMPEQVPQVAHLDKLEHALIFALLAWSGCRIWDTSRRVIIGLLTYGLMIELLQGLTTYRSADALDLLADAAGLFLGVWWVERRS